MHPLVLGTLATRAWHRLGAGTLRRVTGSGMAENRAGHGERDSMCGKSGVTRHGPSTDHLYCFSLPGSQLLRSLCWRLWGNPACYQELSHGFALIDNLSQIKFSRYQPRNMKMAL